MNLPSRPDGELDAAQVWHALATGRCRVLFAADEGGRRRVVVACRLGRAMPDWSRLSSRERAILARAATGKAQKVIAIEMECSCAAVSSTLRKVRRRFDFATTYALCRAYAAGVLTATSDSSLVR